jgi:hypothetical protein
MKTTVPAIVVILLFQALLPAKDVYLLTGQSNMVGQATIEPQDTPAIQRVYLLDALGQWEIARNSLARYSSCGPGDKLGPGYTFAKTLAAAIPDKEFGIVHNGCNSMSIDAWNKSGDLYRMCVQRTKQGLQTDPRNKLRAILWHQGESDAAPYAPRGNEAFYMGKLKTLVRNFRTDFGDSTLPFIVGQIPQVKWDWIDCAEMNRILLQAPDSIPYSAVAGSDGLTVNPDGIHFDSRSQRILGERYAQKVVSLCYGVRFSPETLSFTVNQGAANPSAQVAIVKTTTSMLPTLSAMDDAGWINAAITGTGDNQVLSVQIQLAGLASGIHRGAITATGTGVYLVLPVSLRINGTPVASNLTITPQQTYVQPGRSVVFSASILDQFGEVIGASVNWTVSGGGTINLGAFTSNGTLGRFQVIAACGTNTAVTDTAVVTVTEWVPGIKYEYYELTNPAAIPDFSALSPAATGYTDVIGLGVAGRTDNFGVRFTGFVSVPADGAYTFSLAADDEATLGIDGADVLRAHWTNGERTTTVNLSAGMHAIAVEYYQGNGGAGLTLQWKTPAMSSFGAIPPGALVHRPDSSAVGVEGVSRAKTSDLRRVEIRIAGKRLAISVPASWDRANPFHVEIFDLLGRMVVAVVLDQSEASAAFSMGKSVERSLPRGNYLVRLGCAGTVSVSHIHIR